jgi:hypothetical protein
MRKWVVPLLLILMLLLPQGVRAQQMTPTLDKVEIELWPEYDRPTVLVIYTLFLAPGTQLPASLTLRIPSKAGNPFAVAERGADGTLNNAVWSVSVLGNWSMVTLTATSMETRLEYYDPGLEKNGAVRKFSYEWQGDYAVKSMSVQIQQPVGATDMHTTPSLGSGSIGEGNLTYYKSTVGAVPAGTKFKLALDYTKTNDDLSAPSLEVQPSAPITSATPGRTLSPNVIMAYLLGALGVLLLVGGGFWYWRASRPSTRNPQGRRRHNPRIERLVEVDPGEDIYCHQCGNRAAAGDVFCRLCGTGLRKE